VRRPGLLTLADVIGIIVVFFIFGVLAEPIMSGVFSAWSEAGPLASAVFAILPAVILVGFLKAIWELQATRFVQQQQRERRQRRPRREQGGRR